MKRFTAVVAPALWMALLVGCSALGGGDDTPSDPIRWQRITSGSPDQTVRHDTLRPDNDGPFRKLRLQTQGNVEFDRVVVSFRNGERVEPTIRQLHAGNPRVIDLPGEAKRIESVELWYRAMGSGQPEVVVMGGN